MTARPTSTPGVLQQILTVLQGQCSVLERILETNQANGVVLRDIRARLNQHP